MGPKTSLLMSHEVGSEHSDIPLNLAFDLFDGLWHAHTFWLTERLLPFDSLSLALLKARVMPGRPITAKY
jgi:hypothetical protein